MIQEEKTVKDFGEIIKKAVSNLSIAVEKCVKEFQDFEKRIDYASQPLIFSERYGIVDNNDWKILDVNCLPEDILVNKEYEFEVKSEDLSFYPDWGHNSACDIFQLLRNLNNGFQIRYRITPTKKSHEELAEEYIKNKCKDYPENETYNENDLKCAYFDGRKSMESE